MVVLRPSPSFAKVPPLRTLGLSNNCCCSGHATALRLGRQRGAGREGLGLSQTVHTAGRDAAGALTRKGGEGVGKKTWLICVKKQSLHQQGMLKQGHLCLALPFVFPEARCLVSSKAFLRMIRVRLRIKAMSTGGL